MAKTNIFKEAATKRKENFFQQTLTYKTNNYFVYDGDIDNDTIIIRTDNLIVNTFTNKFILKVGTNKAVYLNANNIRKIRFKHANGDWESTYLVKLNRNYFKVYTFQKAFDDYLGNDKDFDALKEIAKSQKNIAITFGKQEGSVYA